MGSNKTPLRKALRMFVLYWEGAKLFTWEAILSAIIPFVTYMTRYSQGASVNFSDLSTEVLIFTFTMVLITLLALTPKPSLDKNAIISTYEMRVAEATRHSDARILLLFSLAFSFGLTCSLFVYVHIGISIVFSLIVVPTCYVMRFYHIWFHELS